MSRSLIVVAWCVPLVLSISRPLGATPPRAPTIRFELPSMELPHAEGETVTLPLTLRALRQVPAGTLAVLDPPARPDAFRIVVPYPDMAEGTTHTVSLSLPFRRVGAHPFIVVASLAQLDAVVLVRPERILAMTHREFEEQRVRVLRAHGPIQGGESVDGLRIAVTAEKRRFEAGEPIGFHLSIANGGSEPRTVTDGDLGDAIMSVYIDGPTVGNQGHGKTLSVAEPFPDGVLRLAPGGRWDGKVVLEDAKDLDEIAHWPGQSFTYRFHYESFGVPFFVSGRDLAPLWQGGMMASSRPGETVFVAPAAATAGAPGPGATAGSSLPPEAGPSTQRTASSGQSSAAQNADSTPPKSRFACNVVPAAPPSSSPLGFLVLALASVRRRVTRRASAASTGAGQRGRRT